MVVHLDTQPLLYSGLGNEHYRKKKVMHLQGKESLVMETL